MPPLILHPDSSCTAVTGLEAQAARPSPGLLALRYVLRGATAQLSLPPTAASVRADELWRHTCFEAFVSAASGEGYYEFNFAPSTAWAAYRFDGYRQGMRPAEGLGAPRIEVRRADDSFELHVLIDLGAVPGLWRVGLSAVIETAAGATSYWALAHPPGAPDFHNADCFALELPETGRP